MSLNDKEESYPKVDLSNILIKIGVFGAKEDPKKELPSDWACFVVHNSSDPAWPILLSLKITRNQWEEIKEWGDKIFMLKGPNPQPH